MQESLRDIIHRTIPLSEAKLSMDKPDEVAKAIVAAIKKAAARETGKVSIGKPGKVGKKERGDWQTFPISVKVGHQNKEVISSAEFGFNAHCNEFIIELMGKRYSIAQGRGKTLDQAVNNLPKEVAGTIERNIEAQNFEYVLGNLYQRMPQKGIRYTQTYTGGTWEKRYKASKLGLITHFKLEIRRVMFGEYYQADVLYPSAYGAMPLENNKTYKYKTLDALEKEVGKFCDAVGPKHKGYTKAFKELEAGEAASPGAAAWPSKEETDALGVQMLKKGHKRRFRMDTRDLTPQEFAILFDMVKERLHGFLLKRGSGGWEQ